jgi:hypothetical protein
LSTADANFARLTGTPEVLVVDFGLNTQMTPNPHEPIKLSLVLDYYTAKRLLAVLYSAVQQHESIYGVLEIHYKSECGNSVREIASAFRNNGGRTPDPGEQGLFASTGIFVRWIRK